MGVKLLKVPKFYKTIEVHMEQESAGSQCLLSSWATTHDSMPHIKALGNNISNHRYQTFSVALLWQGIAADIAHSLSYPMYKWVARSFCEKAYWEWVGIHHCPGRSKVEEEQTWEGESYQHENTPPETKCIVAAGERERERERGREEGREREPILLGP